ncbi:putative N-acetyltransferase YjcF [Microbulbifer aggregans]|uniref:Putative N-acetyltransferase YjcF n=1 Tax=Microbulbifer aggregans TaxID=1769779 RepID=A0A1C9WA01_9GAMM|nr:GNAT family N-acetyltransferase [Microbulbifer aggregans]AOS97990.1 putative N-acetyltransferase YjcF [Microbulbifer aggregans]
MAEFEIAVADWDRDLDAIRMVRETVFIREQKVDPAIEWDDQETSAAHFLVRLEGEPVATGRLTSKGKIGRMAVLPAFRGRGLGLRLLEAICNYARSRGLHHVFLHAQCHAQDFYAKSGFQPVGGEFEEADIPHIKMERSFD